MMDEADEGDEADDAAGADEPNEPDDADEAGVVPEDSSAMIEAAQVFPTAGSGSNEAVRASEGYVVFAAVGSDPRQMAAVPFNAAPGSSPKSICEHERTSLAG